MGTGATAVPVPLKWPLPLRPVAVEAHLCYTPQYIPTLHITSPTHMREVVPELRDSRNTLQ